MHDISHHRFMTLALSLARRQLGQTWPNPAVGAVVVKDGQILGVGATARGGRPHAETLALAQAGDAAKGAILYVSLEPCSHQGKTPPCAEAVIRAGIAQVVVACRDTNPLISGRGIGLLAQAGIAVTEGVCEAEARALNAGFFSVMAHRRPLVSVKLATS
ncbi:MAG: bifunctional diaminohydroxyphosphoribosylaminopyrimidine deaminase/5-amino-6-(5-phosphoribosylamino)uracil reductase RibD, partial [Rickettsiales bacterium]|nr:bifunctional diaminohydroxyphosphoribosylaminopyrimidine deaminase/5-amino-6-(5-phosphoribosylamino)uracil reductase RibD [Rickettsiales bacterium]